MHAPFKAKMAKLIPYFRGFIKFLCMRSVGFFSRAFLVFLMKESKRRRRKQPGKLMAKSRSQPVNLPGARPLMNPLLFMSRPAESTSPSGDSVLQSCQVRESILLATVTDNIIMISLQCINWPHIPICSQYNTVPPKSPPKGANGYQ